MCLLLPPLLYALLFWVTVVQAYEPEVLPDQIYTFDNQNAPVNYHALQQTHPVTHYDLD